jgi:hypothetical protein
VVPERKAYAESPVLDAYLHDRFARMRGAFGTTPEGRKKALKVAWRFLNENHSTPAVIDSFVTALDAAVPILTPREFYGYLKCRPFELSGRSVAYLRETLLSGKLGRIEAAVGKNGQYGFLYEDEVLGAQRLLKEAGLTEELEIVATRQNRLKRDGFFRALEFRRKTRGWREFCRSLFRRTGT